MKRLLFTLLPICLVFASVGVSVGCGNITIRGAIQPGTVSGFVSIVQLSEVGVGNGTVQVTFVTFLQNGASSTFGFCGDQRSLFPMDQTVRAEFDQGQTLQQHPPDNHYLSLPRLGITSRSVQLGRWPSTILPASSRAQPFFRRNEGSRAASPRNSEAKCTASISSHFSASGSHPL